MKLRALLAAAGRLAGRARKAGAQQELFHRSGWITAGPEGADGTRGHFVRRGMGRRSGTRGGDLFRGRQAALAAVTGWLNAAQAPGQVLVVTGQPGAGKSAVLGRVVLDFEAGHAEAGLAFHARRASLADFLRAVSELTGSEVADSIDGLVERVRSTLPAQPWRIVIDALDEAATEAERRSLVDAIVELAGLPQVRAVVATRALAAEHRFAAGTLLNRLGVTSARVANLVDLDEDRFFDFDDLQRFAAALLRQDGAAVAAPPGGAWTRYRGDERLCRRLANTIAAQAGRNHLVAALAAEPLSRLDEVVDPAGPGFDLATVPRNVDEALTGYLDRLAAQERVKVRGLLTALAYARGDGIDDRRWLTFAAALGHDAGVPDLDLLRSTPAADYLLQTTSTRDAPVTRLFHQALTDELLATRSRPFDERQILDTLLPTAAELAGQGPPGYVRRYLVAHAAAAGLLDDGHVPTGFLPWETSGKVSVLLGFPRPRATGHQNLNAWAALEPYLVDADHTTRQRSLGFAIAAMDRRDGAASPAPQEAITPQWIHWLLSSNILVHVPGKASIRTLTTFTSAYGQQLVAAGCRDSTVRIWDLTTGEQTGRALTSPQAQGSIWGVTTFYRDDGNQFLATCGEDGAVRIWNLNDGRETVLLGHTNWVRGLVTFVDAAGRRMLASASYDSTVRLWDVEAAAPACPPLTGHTEGVHAIGVFADAQGLPLLATGGRDGTLRIWSPAGQTQVGPPIDAGVGWIRAIQPIRDHEGRQLIAAGGYDRRIRFWDPYTGEEAREPMTLPGPGRVTALSCLAGSGEDTLLISGATDRVVRIWSLRTGEQLTPPKFGHGNWISAVATFRTGDGRDLIVSSAGPDCTLRMWDPKQVEPGTSGSSLGWIRGVAFGHGPAGDLLVATGSGDRKVRLWDATTGAQTAVLRGHTDWVRSICVLPRRPGGPTFVTAGADRTVRIWDAGSGAQTEESGAHDASIWAVTAFADERSVIHVASGDRAGRIVVWRPGSAHSPLLLDGHAKGIRGLTTFRQSTGEVVLASVSADGMLGLWDPQTGTALREPIPAHAAAVCAVAAFTAGGAPRLVTCGADHTARIWDPATGEQVAEFRGHTGVVLSVAAMTHSCGRSLLITGAGDGDVSLRVWDVPSQRRLASLVIGAQVQSVAAWPADRPVREAMLAFGTVAGVAAFRVNLDLLCAAPGCEAKPRPAAGTKRCRVLVLGAAAEGDLRVGREQKLIREAVDRALHRDRLEIDFRPAATTSDLLDGLTRFRPHIVHFSGHSSHDVLVFEDEVDAAHHGNRITAAAFARAVAATDDPPLLVLLNSCHSASQIGQLVRQVVPMAIGMAGRIDDNDAIVYAAQFYAAIANGLSIHHAHLSARVALELAGSAGHELPTLVHAEGGDPLATVLVA